MLNRLIIYNLGKYLYDIRYGNIFSCCQHSALGNHNNIISLQFIEIVDDQAKCQVKNLHPQSINAQEKTIVTMMESTALHNDEHH